jgi:hypothetical protein
LTTRERNLLILFLVVVASAILVVATSSYLEGLTRLDSEFIDLQKRASRAAQASVLAQKTGSGTEWSGLKGRFFAQGTLQDPLVLASRVQAALKSSDLVVVESRVAESSSSAQWIQYHAEGQIESWFHFLQLLRNEDAKTLFRSLSLAKKQGSSYSITFEVGHVVLP